MIELQEASRDKPCKEYVTVTHNDKEINVPVTGVELDMKMAN